MKIRNGFVSNSSSSSFIVPPNLKEEAEASGLVLISVKTLKDIDKRLKWISESKLAVLKELPYFLGEPLSYRDSIDSLDNYGIDKIPDDYYISEPYDRDEAYRRNFCDSYGTFATDL